MIHRVQTLLQEIHRRSVWQVLGTYLVGSWGVLQGVDFVTGFAGLPSWTTRFAFVLLLVGLPIVGVTAAIQKRTRGLGGEYHEELRPDESEGPSEGEVPPDEEARPLHLADIFTWRNALLGGAGAALLLVAAVASYLIMWALGIGPVGSLLAQGVIDARDPVILADFDDRTNDSTLAASVTEALRVDLVESKVVTLVDGRLVSDALQRMGRDPGEHLTTDVAREVAVREGLKAVVEGDVSRVGSGYLLAASIVMPDDGHAVAAFRENATDDSDLLPAIDRLSQRLREKVGESLREVRAGQPLEAVTTTSLEALRKFTEAKRASARGDPQIALLLEAVALDSTFAMAWRNLAVAYYNVRAEQPAIDAATEAYENRDHLTDRERQLAVAFYHKLVTGDQDAQIAAYRRVLEDYPDDPSALNNLAIVYAEREEWGAAASLLERAISGPARSPSAVFNQASFLYNAGRKDDLPALYERARELYPWSEMLMALGRARALLGSGEPDSARAVLREARAEGGDRYSGVVYYADGLEGRIALSQGKLDEAERSLREDLEDADAYGRGWRAQAIAIAKALTEVHLVAGADTATELKAFEREAEMRWSDLPPLERPYDELGRFWAQYAHDAERAEYWWDQLRAATPEAVKQGRAFVADELYRKQWISLLRGKPEEALAALRELQRRRPCRLCDLRETAAVFEALQQPDSAIAALERWVGGDELDRAAEREDGLETVLPALARLYEQVGRIDDARDTWLRFADRWADADAVLQPRVREARERAAALAERGGG